MSILKLVDTVGTYIGAFYGTLLVFAFGLHFDFIQGFFAKSVTLFGVLSPEPPLPEYSLIGIIGGCFGGAVGAVNMRAIVKNLENETEGAKVARQDMNFIANGAWFLGWTLGYFSSDWEFITGSFGTFWLVIFSVLALGYLVIVQTEWDQLRAPMSKHLFNSDYGDKLELVDGFLFVMYGVGMFLSATLHLGFIQDPMINLMSMFGMLSPVPDSFGFTLEALAAGAFALSQAALHLFAFCGVNEDVEIGKVRRYSSIVFWTLSVLTWNKYPETGSFYTFWVSVSLFFAIYLTMKSSDKSGKGTVTEKKAL